MRVAAISDIHGNLPALEAVEAAVAAIALVGAPVEPRFVRYLPGPPTSDETTGFGSLRAA